jgi:hypothetical protein
MGPDDPLLSRLLLLPRGQRSTRSNRYCQTRHGRDRTHLDRLPVMARSTHYQVSIRLDQADVLKLFE